MSRIRSIKPDFFLDEVLAATSAAARLLFIGLWTLADKAGLLEDRPARIKVQLFPYEDEIDIESLLAELSGGGFIQRYEAEGRKCIAIRNFAKHQRPHPKETLFGLPHPPTGGAPTEESGKRWVYFVQGAAGGPVKIGTATHVGIRLSSLQTSTPDWLNVLGVIEAKAKLENELHKRFDSLRLNGEWFRPEPELLAFIREHAVPFDKSTDVRGRPRTSPDASRRVLLVVGDGGGDGGGDGCGNGLPGDAGPLPLTAYADSHEQPPPESYIHSEVAAATDFRGLLPHEPPPATEPPLVEHLRSDWRELRGGEYGGDRGDDAAMRELLARGPSPEIRRRWRIGIAVPPGKYGRVSKLADLVRLWNDCDAAPSTPPPVRHAIDVGRAEAPSGPCVAGCGAEAWAQTWGHRLCVRCTATLQVQVGSLSRASVSAWVESRRQGQGVAP